MGANYREANRAESRADFIHKIAIVEKECSESGFWIEICEEANLGSPELRKWLSVESRELLAIFTSIGRSTKATALVRNRGFFNSKSEIRNSKF